MAELKRIFSLKRLCVLFLLCAVNIGLFLYGNPRETDEERISRDAAMHAAYIENYPGNIDEIITNAERLKKYSIFTQAGTFAYSNILQTSEDFKRVDNVVVTEDEYLGVEKFVQYYYIYYIAFAFVLFVVYDLFKSRDNGVWQLDFCAKRGREYLAVWQMFIIFLSSFITLAALYFSTFAAAMLRFGGISDLGNPIQNIQIFEKFTYPLSKIQYVLILFLVSWASLCCLALILWSVFMVFRYRNHGLVIVLIFIGAEILIYSNISMHSAYNVFHFINIVNIVRINDMISGYQNWGFKTYVFSVSSVVIFSLFIITAVSCMAALLRSADMRPYCSSRGVLDKISSFVNQNYQKIFSRSVSVLMELHKLIITSKGVWIVLIVIISVFYFSSNGKMNYTDAQLEKDKIYLEHGGSDFSYIRNMVDEKRKELEAVMQRVNEYTELKNSGQEINIGEYAQVMETMHQISAEYSSMSEYSEKLDYLDELKTSAGAEGWLISDRGWQEIIGQNGYNRELILLIILSAGVMLIISEGISIEYRTGMYFMINAAAKGRKPLKIRKACAGIIFTVILFLIVYGIDLIFMWKYYGMPYLDAPLCSLTFVGDMLGKGIYKLSLAQYIVKNISIWGFLCLGLAVRLLLVLAVMASAMVISNVIKKQNNRGVILVALALEIFIIVLFSRLLVFV